MRVAFITGITGQDGSYLCELLLGKQYIVYGMLRRASLINTARIDHVFSHKNLRLVYGDVLDCANLLNTLTIIRTEHPNMTRLEVYNLAAQSHVKISFALPEYTGQVDALGTTRLLEAIRSSGLMGITRFYQASTSEMYGLVQETPQTENTPFYPRSPYGCAKLYAFWITKNYRESYGMFACNGILYNHESERRGHNFVTRKITIGLGKILSGHEQTLVVGNLDARRDWGHAKDFVRGMWMMLQQERPDDYLLATGRMHSVREFIETAFQTRGFEILWKGDGIEEVGYDKHSGTTLITVSPRYFRPAEVDELCGDASKAARELGWVPKISFQQLVEEMVDHDAPVKT